MLLDTYDTDIIRPCTTYCQFVLVSGSIQSACFKCIEEDWVPAFLLLNGDLVSPLPSGEVLPDGFVIPPS